MHSTMDVWTYREGILAPGVSPRNVVGYSVEARDGSIGKVDDATYDAGSSHLVVDTGPWIFGKKVMLPAGVIENVDHDREMIFVERTKDEIKRGPPSSTTRSPATRTIGAASAPTTARPAASATAARTSCRSTDRTRGGPRRGASTLVLRHPRRREWSRVTRVSHVGARIVEHVRRLEPDEAAIGAREGERLTTPVDGLAPDCMLECDSLVPAVPVLVSAERAGDAGSPALEEVEDRLGRHSPRTPRVRALAARPGQAGPDERPRALACGAATTERSGPRSVQAVQQTLERLPHGVIPSQDSPKQKATRSCGSVNTGTQSHGSAMRAFHPRTEGDSHRPAFREQATLEIEHGDAKSRSPCSRPVADPT